MTPPKTKTDTEAMDDICRMLNRQEWNADTLDAVAAIVRLTGRAVEDI